MDREQLIKSIRDNLSVLKHKIEVSNGSALYDVNKIAEDIVCPVLNEIYDINLINVNSFERNHPTIDLGDKQARFCVQITSNADRKKVRKTLKSFCISKLYTSYDRILILGLVKSAKISTNKLVEDLASFGTNCVVDVSVFDLSGLFAAIASLDMVKLKKISKLLDESLTKYESSADILEHLLSKDYISEHWGVTTLQMPYGHTMRMLTAKHPRAQERQPISIYLELKSGEQYTDTLTKIHKSLDRGDELVIPKNLIAKYDVPKFLPSDFQFDAFENVIIRPIVPDNVIKFKLELSRNMHVLSTIDLRMNVVRKGLKEIVLSNEKQEAAFVFTVTHNSDQKTINMSYSVNRQSHRIKELCDAQGFYLQILKADRIALLGGYEDDEVFVIEKETEWNEDESKILDFLKALRVIETQYRVQFKLPEVEVSIEEARTVFAIAEFIEVGFSALLFDKYPYTFHRDAVKKWKLRNESEKFIMAQVFPNAEIVVLGLKLYIGRLLMIAPSVLIGTELLNNARAVFESDPKLETYEVTLPLTNDKKMWIFGSTYVPAEYESAGKKLQKATINKCFKVSGYKGRVG